MINKLNEVVKGLNILEAERLKKQGYNNDCFFNSDGTTTKEYSYYIKEGKKYFKLNCGYSGVFMVDLEGEIYNIKGYGVADKKKKIKSNLGNINNYFVDGVINIGRLRILSSSRYNYTRGGFKC